MRRRIFWAACGLLLLSSLIVEAGFYILYPYPIYGRVKINSVPQAGIAVRVRDSATGDSETVITNAYGEYLVDLANFPQGYTDGDIITVTLLINPIEEKQTYVDLANHPDGREVLFYLPIAAFKYLPTGLLVGETATLNASDSYDPDGFIASYTWNFGDGNITTATTPIIYHVYVTVGNFTVTLTVTDNDGLTATTSQTVKVITYPTASFTWSPQIPKSTESVTFDASASTANSGYIVSYMWNFGDGNTTTLTTALIAHRYSVKENYAVTLTVTNSEGLSSSKSEVITVVGMSPSADFTWQPAVPQAGETATFDASASAPNGGTITDYAWNFGDGNITSTTNPTIMHVYTSPGLYNVTLTITDSEGLADTASRQVPVGLHDVAITNVTSSKTVVCQGYSMKIVVTVANQGTFAETFNLTLYANTIIIQTRNVTLLIGNSTTITFAWGTTGWAKGNYTISAYAWPVLGETDTTDNMRTDGWVVVAMVGDVTGPTAGVPDGKVDIRDLAAVAKLYGVIYPDPRYNPNCDINGDGKIDIRDLAIAVKNYGKIDP